MGMAELEKLFTRVLRSFSEGALQAGAAAVGTPWDRPPGMPAGLLAVRNVQSWNPTPPVRLPTRHPPWLQWARCCLAACPRPCQ